MKVSKRKFIVIITIMIVIAIIPIIAIIKDFMHWTLLAKDTEKKISQINASEFETKLIKELENSKLNIDNTSFDISFEIGDKYFPAPYEGYILASIKQKNEAYGNRVFIPFFKIESDNNGKVQNITYIYSDYFGIGKDLVNTVDKILQEQYGIKGSLEWIKNYSNKYYNFPFGAISDNDMKDMSIFVTDEEFGASVLSKLCKSAGYTMSESEIKYDIRNNKAKITMNSWK